ncbi:MFS transporter [[Mycoplasma] testudinis]|uniref:MFS transporter n=1 Tax=[Mycoplasma] testudinis TaxID=33924 RepID=UPI000485575B|nr:MFS transporter [[Mycoplasma] testudinis]
MDLNKKQSLRFPEYKTNAIALFDPNKLSDNDQIELNKKSKQIRKLWMAAIVLGCFFIQMIPYGISQNIAPAIASNIFTQWLSNHIILVNLVIAFLYLGTATAGPFAGMWFFHSKKSRHVYFSGFLILAIAYACLGIGFLTLKSLAGTAVILYVFVFIMGIGISIFSNLGISQLINRWFMPKQRGLALGVSFMGGSIGTVIFSSLLKFLIVEWKSEPWAIFILFGGLALVVGSIVTAIIVRHPYPVFETVNNKKTFLSIDLSNESGVDIISVKKYPYWYLLIIGYFLLTLGMGILDSQAQQNTNGLINLNNPFINSDGLISSQTDSISKNLALNITAVYGVACLFGNLIGGRFNDKIGPVKSFCFGWTTLSLAGFMMLFSSTAPSVLPYLWGTFSGLGVYMVTSTPSFLAANLFGTKTAPKHLGIFTLVVYGGQTIGLIVAGLIAGQSGLNADNQTWINIHHFLGIQISGNWTIVWIVCLICLFLGGLSILVAIAAIKKMGIEGLTNYYRSLYEQILIQRNWLFIFKIWFLNRVFRIDCFKKSWYHNYLGSDFKKHELNKNFYLLKSNYLKQYSNKQIKHFEKINSRLQTRLQKLILKQTNLKESQPNNASKINFRILKKKARYNLLLAGDCSNIQKWKRLDNFLIDLDNLNFLLHRRELTIEIKINKLNQKINQNKTASLKLSSHIEKDLSELKKYFEDPVSLLSNWLKIKFS